MSDIVIRAEGVSKKYRLGVIGYGTLRQDIQSWWARLRGRDDPNSAVSFVENQTGTSGDFWALKDVSFEISQGDVVGVVGRNGAGKSVLLKLLSRVTAPTSGIIKLKGRVASLLEVGTGFHPELTGRENIYLNGAILGMSKKEVSRKFDEIVSFSEIEKFIDTPVKRYSSGMYVRLAFAVAAHLEPEILIVDEVLAVGDAQFQKKCIGKMEEVGKEGRTVLFVSHNMGAVKSMCNKGIMLSKGEIKRIGDVSEVINEYFSEGYVCEATVEYEDDPDKLIYIKKVSIINNDGNYSAEIDMLKPFRIELEYVVNDDISSVEVGCSIFAHSGEHLIDTADHDLNKERLGKRKRGLNKTSVEIPGHLLNSGEYTIVAYIVIQNVAILDYKEALRFHVYDSGSFMMGTVEGKKDSLLLLGLNWEQN